jgi:methyl-accepting chemotaxis protein
MTKMFSRGFFGGQSSSGGLEFQQMMDEMPTAVMMCDLDFRIIYANRASITALRKIEHVLPTRADNIVGSSIDIFHKNPSHQRRMLSDPRNLPHKARITIGGEWLDLNVSAIMDAKGNYLGPMLAWSIITDLVKQERETKKMLNMLDLMPINVMLADGETLEITYANKTSMDTLRPLEHLLPCRANDIIGKNIDIFHKNPSHQRRMLGDHKSVLPHRAIIPLGKDKLELSISSLNDPDGKYVGPLVTWSVVTENINMATRMEEVVSTVSSASAEMRASAESMRSAAEQGNSKSSAVAAASEQLNASITEISRQISKVTEVTRAAMGEAEVSAQRVNTLADTAQKIGEVVNLINDIARQTNLLALNATIEAARAGEAGKGFAVVASEVKALATQTARATEQISDQVRGIQDATSATVRANQSINQKVDEINQIAGAVAAAVEEQTAATHEVAQNITSVSQTSAETGRIAEDVQSASGELAQRAEELKNQLAAFLARFTNKKQ